jgi:hypothetical protein
MCENARSQTLVGVSKREDESQAYGKVPFKTSPYPAERFSEFALSEPCAVSSVDLTGTGALRVEFDPVESPCQTAVSRSDAVQQS